MPKPISLKGKTRVCLLLALMACCALAAALFTAPQGAWAASSASDDFARANGSLGPNWTDMSDGGLAISSDAVVGTNGGGNSGDMWTADSFTSDQFSQVTLTGTQLTGTQWIGAAVRAQSSGQSAYVGLYFWDNGSPELMLFLRHNGGWSLLGSYATAPLPGGTQLTLTAVGNTLSLAENGTQVIATTDSTLAGGTAGIIANALAQAAAWAGGDASGTGGATYSLGGTVSGLSGTVVLKDNGGDTLSVTSNGSFTFGTQLAAGASYNVTVASYPAGQTCSVANGSGTMGAANVTNVAVSCAAASQASSASDDFARANGSLGPNWTDMSDGGLAISSDAVVGTNGGGNSGDMWTADSFTSDQFSQVTLTGTQLTGTQWIGAAVRAQSSGQSAYVGLYFWDNGSPELMLFLRHNGGWSLLGSYATAPLPGGTQLTLTAVGNTLSLAENGTQVIATTDSTLAGGTAGIIANALAQAAAWAGGDASGTGGATYSLGGTVSGLSGTVVLKDNGGDTLSVTSNGSFTFGTQLAAGASYNVTVASYPAGQTCSVANGSGTMGAANVTNVAVSCAAASQASSASDDFARANGSLGPNWTDMSDGGLAISSDAVVGTNGGGNSGDMWTADSFTSDQFSQVTLTGTQLTGTQWIGAAVRAQSSGQSAYVGLYFWDNGSPELMLFLRHNGGWSLLGSYATAPLPGGTQLTLTAVGNTLSLAENGTQVIATTDSTLAGGTAGIIANALAQAAAWAGGDAGFQVSQAGTASGITSYNVISANDGYGPQTLRVVQPTNPAPGVAHNFLIVLPVEAGTGDTYGDGLATMQGLDAQDRYNLTIVEPTFDMPPWYANNATDPNLQYETFMADELVPWMKKNLSTTGHEQIWLIGFSKSGVGAQDLILKHPDLFTLAASWDFPADISSYSQYGDSAAAYGTDANFQANYRLTPAFVQAHAAPFQASNRIWLGGYSLYQADVSDYDALLTSEGVQHTMGPSASLAHRWDSGWVPAALAGLYADSLSVPPGS